MNNSPLIWELVAGNVDYPVIERYEVPNGWLYRTTTWTKPMFDTWGNLVRANIVFHQVTFVPRAL